jgi:hypothetical protein
MTVSDGDTLVGINGCPVILPPCATTLETQKPTIGVTNIPAQWLFSCPTTIEGLGLGLGGRERDTVGAKWRKD